MQSRTTAAERRNNFSHARERVDCFARKAKPRRGGTIGCAVPTGLSLLVDRFHGLRPWLKLFRRSAAVRTVLDFRTTLFVLFLLTLASTATAQIKTSKPGQQVERHLPTDWKFREWSLDENVPDDIKRIKVCRTEEVCKMRFKEGVTPRMRIRNLVVPLRYEDENISISEAFIRQVQQALEDLHDKRGVTARFIGYTDSSPLTDRDQQTYGNQLTFSKAMAHRVAEAMREKLGSTVTDRRYSIESDGRGSTHPVADNDHRSRCCSGGL